MAAKNDITGDSIQTKLASVAYINNFDKAFGTPVKKEHKKRYFKSVNGFDDTTDYIQIDYWTNSIVFDTQGNQYKNGPSLAFCLEMVAEGTWVEFERD